MMFTSTPSSDAVPISSVGQSSSLAAEYSSGGAVNAEPREATATDTPTTHARSAERFRRRARDGPPSPSGTAEYASRRPSISITRCGQPSQGEGGLADIITQLWWLPKVDAAFFPW